MPRSSDTLCSTSVTLSNECQGGMDRNRESGNSDSAFSDSGEDVQGDQSTTSAIALAEAKLNGQSPQTASTGGDTAPSRLLARRASQQDAPLLALLDHNAPLLEVPARHEHYSRPNSMFGLFEHATARHPADTAASPLDTPREEEEPHVIPEETSLTAGDEDGWTGPHSPLPSFEQSQSAHGVHVPFSRSPGSSNLNAEARERPPFISVASGPLARLQEDVSLSRLLLRLFLTSVRPSSSLKYLQSTIDVRSFRTFYLCAIGTLRILYLRQPTLRLEDIPETARVHLRLLLQYMTVAQRSGHQMACQPAPACRGQAVSLPT